MNRLSYAVVYEPSKGGKSVDETDINFLCVDNKLHIRLREYDHPEVIKGFINKLTYVVTYLFQRVDNSLSEEERIQRFQSSVTMLKLDTIISRYLANEYKGIKVLKNYRKIKEIRPGGGFARGSCPLDEDGSYGSLEFLEETLAVPLHKFLFEDAYSLCIFEEVEKDKVYSKFTNKVNRKKVGRKIEYIPLF